MIQRRLDRQSARRKARQNARHANDNIAEAPAEAPAPHPEPVRLLLGDCLDRLKDIADHSVDLIAADLPYGSTACDWDSIIPLDQMWTEFRRVLKPLGSVVLTSAGMFTAQLAVSNPDWFKYRLVWAKSNKTGFALAKRRPMTEHEDITVFSPGVVVTANRSSRQMTYNPQGLIELPAPKPRPRQVHATEVYGQKTYLGGEQTHTGYPTSIQEFASVGRVEGRHPTEKPLDLMAWIIKTYSNPGDVVLDPTMGRGTTGVAAVREGRQFVGIEQSPHWYAKASERIADELRPIAVAA